MSARIHAIGQAGGVAGLDAEPAFLHDLAQVEAHAWALLEGGVTDRHSPCRAPSIATSSEDGPQVRTVTLRHVDRTKATLRFNADARGGLVNQLVADPRAAVHAYHAAQKTQLRLHARAVLHRSDALALATWQVTDASAKRCYLVPPPGSPAGAPASGLPPALERRRPREEESDAGFLHFCVVELKIEAIEWLHLHAIHKRRARFEWREGHWQGTWLTP